MTTENEHKVIERPTDEILDTQRAAEFLDVSGPYLVDLIEGGTIPCSTSRRLRRINAEDLFEYRRIRDGKRKVALDNLAQLNAVQGLL